MNKTNKLGRTRRIISAQKSVNSTLLTEEAEVVFENDFTTTTNQNPFQFSKQHKHTLTHRQCIEPFPNARFSALERTGKRQA